MKIAIIVILVLFILFVGISFGKPYYRYNTLKSHANDALVMDISSAEKIRATVAADAAELGIPLADKDLVVTVGDRKAKVRATWYEVVDFWGYYQKRIDFEMEVEI